PAAVYDASSRTVTASLAKGDVVSVRASCYVQDSDIDVLGLWSWIVDGGGLALRDSVIAGRHWMVTPYRKLVLVHAVRRPLAPPEFQPKGTGVNLKAQRQTEGQTDVALTGAFTYDRKTTAKVDVVATWPEWIDDPTTNADPTVAVQRSTMAFSIPGDRFDQKLGAKLLPIKDTQEWHDTRHREVTYSASAVSKFTEYFVEETKMVVTALDVAFELDGSGQGLVRNSVAVRNTVAPA